MERCPTQAVLPLVGLAAEKVIRDQYITRETPEGKTRPCGHRHVWRPEGVETGTPSEKVAGYLARYANRVVIANDRLTKIEDGEVFFSYKDYRDDNRRKVHHLPGIAFLKRRYGFWGYHVRTENLTRIREQLGVPPVEVPSKETSEDGDEPTEAAEGPRPRHCAICKGEMDYVGGTHRPSARRVFK
ncbi:MAG: transposase [Planctomycetota bacterium]